MILIADASPLIALSLCDQLNLLELLFDEIALPEAVFNEINIPDKPEAAKIINFVRDRIRPVDLSDFIISVPNLGRGELEAMALYKKIHADFLLVDDKKARQIALYNNIKVVGSLGVLLLAKRKGIIEKIRPFLDILHASSIHLSSELYQHVLKLAGEF